MRRAYLEVTARENWTTGRSLGGLSGNEMRRGVF